VNELLTIGYGRDTKEGLQDRFRDLPSPESIEVADVRMENSGSINGKWAFWGEEGIGATLKEIGIGYLACPQLANHYGSTRRGLLQYEAALTPQGALRKPFCDLMHLIGKADKTYCLLCAERKPRRKTKNYYRPNCHRVVLAERLAYELNLRPGIDSYLSVRHVE